MRKPVGIAARIAAVADAFDSLTHKRAYRKAFGVTEAIDMIKKAAGSQLDPRIVAAFERVLARNMACNMQATHYTW